MSRIHRDRFPILLIIFYLINRVFWYSRGLVFDDYGISPNSIYERTHIMQAYSFELMRGDLWQTIWYNHSQPPIYSIFLYLCNYDTVIVHIIYIILGVFSVLALYSIINTLLSGDAQ